MPVDTRDKRASAIGIIGPSRLVLPNPDGAALNAGDRQHVAFSYRGTAAGAPVITFDLVRHAIQVLRIEDLTMPRIVKR